MKYIKIFIAAILALTLTACSDTSTAEVTETSAETGESITTVSEETTETVSETDTLSVESVSDTEAAEGVEGTHWDTIVYDTTLKMDVTDWELPDDNTEYVINLNTFCTIAEAIERANVPDEVTTYWYENSSMYKWCFDNNKEIRGIVSGVKDFDSDGVEETFYAVDYTSYYDEAGMLTSSEIAIYDTEGVVQGVSNGVMNVGCYFACDPAVECKSLDTRRYKEYFSCEGTNMYFTADNIFISCGLVDQDWGYAYANNYYNRLVYENGEYRVESVGTAGWSLNLPLSNIEYTEIYRTASVDGDIPCVIK